MTYIVEFWEEESSGVSGRFRAVFVECDDENFISAELAKKHNFSKIHKYYPLSAPGTDFPRLKEKTQ